MISPQALIRQLGDLDPVSEPETTKQIGREAASALEEAISLRRFLNRIRILHCIDGYEIEQAMQSTGLQLDAKRWHHFRSSPADFFIQADAPTQAALWSIIERREAGRTEPVKAQLI